MAKKEEKQVVEVTEEVTVELEEKTAAVDEAEVLETEADADGETKFTKAGKHSKKAVTEAEAEEERKAKAAEAKDSDEEAPARIQTKPNPINAHGKNWRKSSELVDRLKAYTLSEAVELAKTTSLVKFDASVELHINLGVDPRQADQMVRGTVSLPAGTGKKLVVAVVTTADKQEAAKKAGADIVGGEDLIAKIEKGELGFDTLIATPDMMAKLGKVAKVLGPKGLMPNPKAGTVAADVAKAVTEAKAGKVEYRVDKQSIIHQAIGKVSFKAADIESNAKTLINALLKAKPATAKGTYMKAISMSTTMGPGFKLDVTSTIAESNPKKI